MWYGPDRPKWLGPLEYSYPQHLQGAAPGDYGYDPASLSQEPADFDRNFNYEVLHGRWAMLGGLGALVPGEDQRLCSLCVQDCMPDMQRAL